MNPFLIPCALNTIHSIWSITHPPLPYQPSVPIFNKTLQTASFLYMGITGLWMLTDKRFINLQWSGYWSDLKAGHWYLDESHISFMISVEKYTVERQPISECSPNHKSAWQLCICLCLTLCLMKCQIQWGIHLFASVLLMRCVHEKQTHSSQITVRCVHGSTFIRDCAKIDKNKNKLRSLHLSFPNSRLVLHSSPWD